LARRGLHESHTFASVLDDCVGGDLEFAFRGGDLARRGHRLADFECATDVPLAGIAEMEGGIEDEETAG